MYYRTPSPAASIHVLQSMHVLQILSSCGGANPVVSASYTPTHPYHTPRGRASVVYARYTPRHPYHTPRGDMPHVGWEKIRWWCGKLECWSNSCGMGWLFHNIPFHSCATLMDEIPRREIVISAVAMQMLRGTASDLTATWHPLMKCRPKGSASLVEDDEVPIPL